MSPQIEIANTNRPVMEHVGRLLGRMEKLRKTKLKARWRLRWSITVSGATECRRVLDIIEPYLNCKRAEAQVLRDICDTYFGVPSAGSLDQARRDYRIGLIAELKRLKKVEYY